MSRLHDLSNRLWHNAFAPIDSARPAVAVNLHSTVLNDMRSTGSRRRPVASKGAYANYFEIGHTAFEFVLDFGEAYAGSTSTPAACHTRVVTSPVYMIALLDLIKKSVDDYETAFGRIRGDT